MVPNSSFEEYNNCPTSEDQVEFASGWSKYSTSITTPDYYCSCDVSGFYNVPNNGQGYQIAHNNCNAYMGIETFSKPLINYREYIGIQLNKPLTKGKKYYASFYAVMSDSYLGNKYYNMPSNKLGIRLSTNSYNEVNPCPVDNFAHIYTSIIINDSINWNKISGNFIADSAYNFLIIGNFFDDAHTDTMHFNCSSCLNYMSYYYIDDIYLGLDSSFSNINCYQSINESTTNINVFPNPVSDYLTIFSNNIFVSEIKLFTVLGELVYSNEFENLNNIQINLSSFPSGYYLINIKDRENQIITKKIFKL